MSALTRKGWRDLWYLRGQALAIALVIAGGVATLVMSQSTYESLTATRAQFYREGALADLWAPLKRAPDTLLPRIRAVPGVQAAQPRLQAAATLSLKGFGEPVRAEVVSLPLHGGQPLLNRVQLRSGRLPDPGVDDEVVVGEAFASAHELHTGDRLDMILRGRERRVRVVGIGTSPEYVYQSPPGAVFPDFERYAVLWMNRHAMERALNMDGAFNNVVLRLEPGARPAAVIAALDALLARYGGIGAYGRHEQVSARYLEEELRQLQTMARLFPAIFLGVAAFLLHVVLMRLLGTQREQIGVLKAFGYRNRTLAAHYLGMAGGIACGGTLIGIALGALQGHWLAGVYQDIYRFPFLAYHLSLRAIVMGFAVSLAAAWAGAAMALRAAVRLPPAEAMRPPAPPRFRPTLIERLGLQRWLSQPARMALRDLERRPGRAVLTVFGLAMACAVMMVGRFQDDAIEWMVDTQLGVAQRHDLSVTFIELTPRRAIFELAALPGVREAEPVRSVPVRLVHGHRSYRTVIEGLPDPARLKRTLDTRLQPVQPAGGGLLLTDYLRGMLQLAPGDEVDVQALDGHRRRRSVRVEGFVHEYIGAQGYMNLDALNRLLGDGDVVSGALLGVESGAESEVYRRLNRRSRVAGIGSRLASVHSFYTTMAESLLVFTLVAALLGAVINFGLVYNAARISLSERGRELASLRVLGMTGGEVGMVLLGQLGLLVLLSLPFGFAAGVGLCWLMATGFQSELFRVPVELSTSTFAFAGLVVLGASVVSAWLIRRRIARLDLIAVLKTRE
ncbi:ABC transporter permease [Oleiagrimonas sp. MCCC 1A03011]|uniref:ABC transporter permease n=1 Tax=Oleiagrimonas sp. MCCC 1A03011 TaxID=1926883 RepID=UPI000DC54113|nr:ABC transporter permease [Oleiagrimonas sp. MCCC 1A03011]RAP59152.1 ABC transporter permease [Oleiagrimonas sp. MCCC 1A03011]